MDLRSASQPFRSHGIQEDSLGDQLAGTYLLADMGQSSLCAVEARVCIDRRSWTNGTWRDSVAVRMLHVGVRTGECIL